MKQFLSFSWKQTKTTVRNVRKCCKNWRTLTPKRTTWTSHLSKSATRVTLENTVWPSSQPWSTSGVVSRRFIEVIWWPKMRCWNGWQRTVSSNLSSTFSCTPLVASLRDSSFTPSSSSSASKGPIKRLLKHLTNCLTSKYCSANLPLILFLSITTNKLEQVDIRFGFAFKREVACSRSCRPWSRFHPAWISTYI